MRKQILAACLLAMALPPTSFADSVVDRDYVRIAGVPQVLHYTSAVTASLAKTTHQKYPLVESTTAGTGIRLFCSGLSGNAPDIFFVSSSSANVSTETCKGNGVNQILKLPIGRDALVFFMSLDGKPFPISRRSMYLALAGRVPASDRDFDGNSNPLATTFVPNRFTRWNQIDPKLPDMPIRVLVPPAQAITWWSINDIVMRDGCRAVKPVAALERVAREMFGDLCYNRRTDGAIVYANAQAYGEQPILTPSGPAEIAIAPFKRLSQSTSSIAMAVEGVMPARSAITNGTYPLQRQVFMFVKTEKYSIVPGLQQYVEEITSPGAAAADGYLAAIGLVTLPEVELREVGIKARFSTE
jgi:phosphate transport system substrate-binding protein